MKLDVESLNAFTSFSTSRLRLVLERGGWQVVRLAEGHGPPPHRDAMNGVRPVLDHAAVVVGTGTMKAMKT
jgi:hypothetical protein